MKTVTIIKKSLRIATLAFAVAIAAAVKAEAQEAQEPQSGPGVVEKDGRKYQILEERFTMHFRWDKTNFDSTYLTNPSEIARLRAFLDTIDVEQVDKIEMYSYASPEGSYKHNLNLSKGRSNSMYNYFCSLEPSFVDKLTVDPRGESWDELREYVANDTTMSDQAREKVLSILDDQTISVDTRKWRIEHQANYRYLYKTYYPLIRNTGVMVVTYRILPEPEPIPEPEPEPVAEPEPEPEPVLEPVLLERRHVVALRTNLLYDAFYMPNFGMAPSPNIQAEYYPKDGHFTFNLGFTFPYYHKWDQHKFFQIRDYNIAARYYFKGHGEFLGWYASAYINNNIYGIGLGPDKGWKGEGLGGGLTGGYVMPLSKRNPRWRMEFSLGVGYYNTKYDPYVFGNPITGVEDGNYYYDYMGSASDFKERNHRFQWLGPTEVGVHITYDILYRRIQKKGVGFKRFELEQ